MRSSAWFSQRRRPLISPYGVGTLDQALLATLNVKHHFVRLWGLANRVVVLDEVHAYDTYTSGLIEALLRWLKAMRCSVVLMSATLPAARLRALLRAFTPDAATPPPRFLWRREADRSGLPGTTVLVQAAQAAAWQALQDAEEIGPGYFVTLQGNKPVALETLVQEGRNYRFRLFVNPTVTRAGKRFGLHDDESRHAWLLRQGQRHGFEVLAAERGASARLSVSQGRRERNITLDAVLFDGVLRATDAAALRQAWACGIGPGKALGLGMLSLAPAGAFEVS